MATPTAEVKRVRFSLDDDMASGTSDEAFDGHWDFLKYLLTLREEFNTASVVDALVHKGVISADAGSDVMRQGNPRAQIDVCVHEVMKGGTPAYNTLCETLHEHGYSNIVETLKGERGVSSMMPELTEAQSNTARERLTQQSWSQNASIVPDGLGVQGKKMSLGALSREAKASQREFSIIVERQQELEKQLVQVMKSLDTAKDMLIRERQEKLSLREELKGRDEELVSMQRKYLELQKAMSCLRETNNKYHEKVTKLQIENEQYRREMKGKHELETELKSRNSELSQLKQELSKQEVQMKSQEDQIVSKLDMIERIVGEHRGLVDGQEKLTHNVTNQAIEITRLNEEKAETQTQVAAQQRQLNFQHAQIVMLQEQMQRIEAHMGNNPTGRATPNTSNSTVTDLSDTGYGTVSRTESLPPLPSTPSHETRGGRYIGSLSKGMNLSRPFNTHGKLENSKNTYWRHDSKKGK